LYSVYGAVSLFPSRKMGAIDYRPIALLLSLLAVALTACSSSDPLRHPLTPLAEIELPKDTGRAPAFDLITYDSRNRYLYIAHLSRNQVDIVDVKARKFLGSVPGANDVKGIALSADPNIVFASEGAPQSIGVIDVKKMAITKEIPLGGSPDAIIYDPGHDLVFASLANIESLAVVDAKTYAVKANIALPGAPELSALDVKGGRLFQAINDQDEVVAIDIATQQLTTTYKGCDLNGPKGVAFDPDQGHLFVANSPVTTAGSPVVSIIDVLLDRCLGTVDIGAGPDQAAYNPTLHHLYVASQSSRNLSVIDGHSFQPLGTVGTGPAANSVEVDPTTNEVFSVVGRAGTVTIYHDP
jgi:DNA-binding beta-propeller fold protein YncE